MREGTLCPMTGRSMVNDLAEANANTGSSAAMTNACAKAMRSELPLQHHRADQDGTSHPTSPTSQCCAGFSMLVGIPSTGPTLTVPVVLFTPIDDRHPVLTARTLAPEPPPPKSFVA